MAMLKYFIIASFLLVSTSAAAQENAPVSAKKETVQATASYDWHDGSKGGIYGIGKGWSIELITAKYEPKTEIYSTGEPEGFLLIPAEYEWVKDDVTDLGVSPEMEVIWIEVPAEYENITETILAEEAKVEYYFHETEYNSNGHVLKRKHILPRKVPEVFKNSTRRVIKKYTTFVERRVPIQRKEGFKRVVKTAAKVVPSKPKGIGFTVSKLVQPWRFNIKNPDGNIVHSFDDYEDYRVFERSLY